jgi:hypothetical protein
MIGKTCCVLGRKNNENGIERLINERFFWGKKVDRKLPIQKK